MRPALPADFRKACLLLSLAEGPSHGYEILGRLANLGLEETDPGGVYRLLVSAEEQGLARSKWDPSGLGPPRRVYTLTPRGRRWVDRYAEAIPEIIKVLRRYSAVHKRSRSA